MDGKTVVGFCDDCGQRMGGCICHTTESEVTAFKLSKRTLEEQRDYIAEKLLSEIDPHKRGMLKLMLEKFDPPEGEQPQPVKRLSAYKSKLHFSAAYGKATHEERNYFWQDEKAFNWQKTAADALEKHWKVERQIKRVHSVRPPGWINEEKRRHMATMMAALLARRTDEQKDWTWTDFATNATLCVDELFIAYPIDAVTPPQS